MSWNYRVVIKENDTGENEYGIHEVFYDDEGKVIGMTENSLVPVCSTADDLSYEMDMMLEAFKREVLKFEVLK